MDIKEGLLCVDKPGGLTSHDVVNQIRRLSGIRRVGHAGTLDPLATGLLLLCLGRTTRLVEYLVGQPKVYETTVRLGQTTNTYDADGEITSQRPFTAITTTAIEQTLAQFRGPIQQQPPLYSAIKKDGQPLYKLARKGKTVEVPPRAVTITTLSLLDVTLPHIQLRVACSSGTYIRSLAHDIGEALGCGGHVTALRRTAVGSFDVDQATPLTDLTRENISAHLLPGDTAVSHLPRLTLSDQEAAHVQHGRPIPCQPAHPQTSPVRAYLPDGHFTAILRLTPNQTWQPGKVFHPLPQQIPGA